MKGYVAFFLFAILPAICLGEGGHKDGNKEDRCDGKKIQKTHQIFSIEELSFLVPPPAIDKKKNLKRRYQRAIVNYYQWYLNNQEVIINGLQEEDNKKDLLPPFQISYSSLHQFYEFIREKYPNWVNKLTPQVHSSEVPASADRLKNRNARIQNTPRSDFNSPQISFSAT